MSDLKLTISGANAEELLSNLIATANAMSAGAGFSLSASGSMTVGVEKGETIINDAVIGDATIAAPEEVEAPAGRVEAAPTGRRGGRNKAADKAREPEAEAEENAPKSRRSRGAAKAEDPVNDNEEQAALRAQLIVDLQDLADVEEAHGDVADALKRVGAKSVKEVASASLGDFNEDIQKLIAQHFE